MRLPIRVATAIRGRQLIEPKQRVLIALSGGPDSVALLHCLLELALKRDLKFSICAAHLNHGLRGTNADEDEEFCRRLCVRKGVELVRAYVDTPALSSALKRSKEESARIARHAFLAQAAAHLRADCVAVAHHADDRIETVLYRLCRGTGLSGLQGIGWNGPVALQNEPDVSAWIKWRDGKRAKRRKKRSTALPPAQIGVVRPLLGCTRKAVLEYLESKRQSYCTDETNFDVYIPRNAIRKLVLPLLEEKVHPGTRAALWRLAEEAEIHAEKRAWRREWLTAFANVGRHPYLELPVPRLGSPPATDELKDVLDVLKHMWDFGAELSQRHLLALRKLFNPTSGPKQLQLPSGLFAERRGRSVVIRRIPPKAP